MVKCPHCNRQLELIQGKVKMAIQLGEDNNQDGVNRKEHKVQSDFKDPPVDLLHPDRQGTSRIASIGSTEQALGSERTPPDVNPEQDAHNVNTIKIVGGKDKPFDISHPDENSKPKDI